MQNLAGDPDCDAVIGRELTRCRIPLVRGETAKGEVPASVTGKLGPFAFRRSWRYWVADGPVPLAVAEELFADPVGVTDIRADGDCTPPVPRDVASWHDAEGHVLVPKGLEEGWRRIVGEHASMQPYLDRIRFADDPAAVGEGYVLTYHIDTEVGLRVFVDAILRHGLDKVDRQLRAL